MVNVYSVYLLRKRRAVYRPPRFLHKKTANLGRFFYVHLLPMTLRLHAKQGLS